MGRTYIPLRQEKCSEAQSAKRFTETVEQFLNECRSRDADNREQRERRKKIVDILLETQRTATFSNSQMGELRSIATPLILLLEDMDLCDDPEEINQIIDSAKSRLFKLRQEKCSEAQSAK